MVTLLFRADASFSTLLWPNFPGSELVASLFDTAVFSGIGLMVGCTSWNTKWNVFELYIYATISLKLFARRLTITFFSDTRIINLISAFIVHYLTHTIALRLSTDDIIIITFFLHAHRSSFISFFFFLNEYNNNIGKNLLFPNSSQEFLYIHLSIIKMDKRIFFWIKER